MPYEASYGQRPRGSWFPPLRRFRSACWAFNILHPRDFLVRTTLADVLNHLVPHPIMYRLTHHLIAADPDMKGGRPW